MRIHIFGPSGSGTSTLARAIAAETGSRFLDTDDYYWQPTEPRFLVKRAISERIALLTAELQQPGFVLSGSLCSWGDPLVPFFEVIVYLYVPPDVRLARLRARELKRYGPERLAPGGDLHEKHLDFMDWAERYETGGMEIRSIVSHEAWLSQLPSRVPVLRLDGRMPVPELVQAVLSETT